MRPLRLDIAGFAAFRDPITVDFTDADYFALTGPTGSGKSTVIDAMTFALYGSAPRWGSATSIQYALAPTANRCTIRLVFDVAGQRYVVAREVRRSGKQITQKNPRLERYLDPAATGDPDTDEPTESLAADVSAVKQQVIELLGLDFDDFCTCVVLPQGDFATFLRASVAERQTILLKLLGARHYETIGRLANRRAADANARIEALQGQLNGYADATEEAELTARDRQQQLATRATMGSTEVAALDDVLTARAATTATIDRLTAQFRLLTTVETPAGVGVLQQALAAADNAYATAAQAEQESRTALQAAEDDLRTGPQRGPLEETLRWHAARTSDAARRPEVVAATAQAATALAAAEQTAEQADRDLGLARTEHEQCRARQEQASAAVSAIEERLTLLATVVVPAGTADLGAATAAARSRWDQAVHRWERAEAAIGPVVSVVDALPEPGTITALQRTIDRQEKVLAQRAELAPRLRQAAAELDAAEKVTTKTRHDLDRALADLEQARTQSAAADLRTHLVVGHACPVCDQTVATVPDTLAAPALDTARAAVTKAEQLYRTLAQTEETRKHRHTVLVAKDHALADQFEGLDESITDELSDPLVAGAPSVSARRESAKSESADSTADSSAADRTRRYREIVEALRAEVDQAYRAHRAAVQERRDAEQACMDAQVAVEQAAEQAQQSWASLHAKHGQLCELDPPPVTAAGLIEAWQGLADWAAAQRDHVTSAQLATAQLGCQAANADLQASTERLRQADTAARTAAQQHRSAAVAESNARAERTQLDARLAELEEMLADRPSEADAHIALAEHRRLDDAAATARTQTQTAARIRQQAEAERDRLRYDREAARSALQHSREPLIPLGVPPIDDTDLAAGWAALHDWAHTQAEDHQRTLARQHAQRAAADIDLAARLTDLTAHLNSHQLTIATPDLGRLDQPGGPAQLRRIPTEVELAAERARSTTAEISRRRTEAAGLRATIATDTETEQVARQLARMMSAKQFPQWLADAALDTLVADASESLLALSNGQFELTHEKGEFFVIDHTDADSARSVKTLSGGETFQASLALALALSEQLSTLAAGGRTTLDSIFLDEGFGTPDPDALEIVASTLENLAQGRRMVGVVTHVAALADRVPVRYLVSRDSRTSTIERVGP